MKGLVVTPKFTLECIHCGATQEIDIEGEVDIDPSLVPGVQDVEFEAGGTKIEEGSVVKGVCPRCAELGLPIPEGFGEVEEVE